MLIKLQQYARGDRGNSIDHASEMIHEQSLVLIEVNTSRYNITTGKDTPLHKRLCFHPEGMYQN